MKKWLSLGLAIFVVFALCACSSTLSASRLAEQSSAPVDEPVPAPDEQGAAMDESVPAPDEQGAAMDESEKDSYQTILDDYTVKLQDATPGLIEEYKLEAANNSAGLEGLAAICNAKVTELAEISNDGISEMAKYYYKHGSGSYDEYSEWAGKILDVYMEEAGKIQDAYMDSAK